MGAAERWKVPQANLQKAKQICDLRCCTALQKLPHVNFMILRELGELAGERTNELEWNDNRLRLQWKYS
jgi:hypothetical protein